MYRLSANSWFSINPLLRASTQPETILPRSNPYADLSIKDANLSADSLYNAQTLRAAQDLQLHGLVRKTFTTKLVTQATMSWDMYQTYNWLSDTFPQDAEVINKVLDWESQVFPQLTARKDLREFPTGPRPHPYPGTYPRVHGLDLGTTVHSESMVYINGPPSL